MAPAINIVIRFPNLQEVRIRLRMPRMGVRHAG
jgi:hypothetical protein